MNSERIISGHGPVIQRHHAIATADVPHPDSGCLICRYRQEQIGLGKMVERRR